MSAKRIFLVLNLITAVIIIAGCGGSHPAKRPGTHDFSDPQDPSKKPKADDDMEQDAASAAPFLVYGEVRSNKMPVYNIPSKLRERLQETRPDLVINQSSKFEVFNQQLVIRKDDSSMNFTAVLRIPGKQDESIELKCIFDQKSTPWSCDQMFPVDPKVAEERRLQATVNCLDAYRCQTVGVELFVVIDGKTESQLFQNQKFFARRASSGDVEEAENDVKPLDNPVPMTPNKEPNKDKTQPPKVFEKPRPSSAPSKNNLNVVPEKQEGNKSAAPSEQKENLPTSNEPAAPTPPAQPPQDPPIIPPPPQDTSLSEVEMEEVMNDPNAALEISAPMPMPSPAKGKYSIPGIEQLRPETGNGVKNQAIGYHNGGNLRQGAQLDDSGAGFKKRSRSNRNYGTDVTIQILKGASGAVERQFPNRSPIVIANISKSGGGRLCSESGSCHASHQTGLDVDIAFPSQKQNNDMWSLCGSGGCSSRSHISDDFDADRFWYFIKTMTCANNKPVIAMFVDTQIKKFMCKWAADRGEDVRDPSSCAFRALQAMKHEPGHHNHVHVRFKCPGNRDCRDATVSLGKGTGC